MYNVSNQIPKIEIYVIIARKIIHIFYLKKNAIKHL